MSDGHRCRAAAASVLLLVLLSPGSPSAVAEEEGLHQRWHAVVQETVARIRSLAGWCKDKGLYTCRADAYQNLLHLDPDDAEARKVLGYARDKAGAWIRDPKYKAIRNQAVGAKDYEAKLADLRTWFAEQALPVLEEARSDRRARRSGWLLAALALAGEHEGLRQLNDEVREAPAGAVAGSWILRESQVTRTRREALRQAAREAVAKAPVARVGSVEAVDQHGGLEWPTVLQSERVRVLGFPPREELAQTARYLEALWPVFETALGHLPGELGEILAYGRGHTVYAFDEPAAAMMWLAAQPKADARFVEFVTPLVGTHVPGRSADLTKSTSAEIRLEAAPRRVISRLIQRELGLTKRQAWIFEALSIYLVWHITGTRLIYSVNDVDGRYAEKRPGIPEHIERMSDRESDWLDLARSLFDSGEKPDLFLLPGRDFNEITKPDVLYAYAVAAFVVEGHPERALTFFRGLGGEGGTDLDAVCLATLGFDGKTLDARVHRWLRETTRVPQAR